MHKNNISITSLLLIATLTGCASVNENEISSSKAKRDTPITNGAGSTQNTQVEKLENNQTVTIQTSNGELEVAPTIVATDDQSMLDRQSGDASEDEALEIVGDYYDPLEPVNRAIFTANHYAYKYALIPLAKGYDYITPDPLQASISSAFDNIREPLNLVNNVLSGDFKEAGTNLGRFVVNSTIGLLGLFDPSTHWFGLEASPKKFSTTLSDYEVSSGAFLVIPLLGQSNVRSATSTVVEGVLHPLNIALSNPENIYARGLDTVDDFSSQAELYLTLYDQARDPYTYFRNQYIQQVNRDELARESSTSEINAVEKQ